MTEAARTTHGPGDAPATGVAPALRGPRVAPSSDVTLTSDDLGGAPLGARATVVQFSSTFCVPCRRTRQVVEHALRTEGGVTHVDLDVADHLALGERLAITSTPTVLVLDATGRVRRRASGVPSLAQLRAAVADASAAPAPEVASS
ncbi:thioredoxin family protein [Cellulomonas fimi]|uniref:TlpA family protein disulfide reductase n=1 Tax=Cellulomonas fimi TaxID=1708 RepID=UPI00234C99A3|nr:thioredoxin family protein [Cellulomonas fimi]MDC7121281.1 thioredoxin family protein [Cellulomonas fimi]